MGSTAATIIASNIELDTSYASIGTLNVSMTDFVTLGWSNASAATVQSIEVQFKVNGSFLHSSETGLPNGTMAPATVSVPIANLDGASFRMDTFAMDRLEIFAKTSSSTKTLASMWAIIEASSSPTLGGSSVSFTPTA